MSEIRITPNFDEKTAVISGAASAGEKVRVILKNCSTKNTPTLRLRVLFVNKMLAVFPVAIIDDAIETFTVEGDDLVCELNLCTDQALKTFKRIPELEVMFILDDIGGAVRTMHFRDFHTLLGWPQENADTPIDLSGYADRMQELGRAVDEVRESLDTAVDRIETNLNEKVDKVSGKGLSSIDVTPEMVAGFASAESLAEHIANQELHLRSGERIEWSGKVNSAELAAKQDIIVHGGALYVPSGGDYEVQRWHRAQIVFNEEIGFNVLDISETQYIFEDGTFKEVVE